MKTNYFSRIILSFCLVLSLCHSSYAQEDADYGKKLSNPISDLISVPIEFDTYSDIGRGDHGTRFSITAKPVIPISLNNKWNLISRTIVSYTDQKDIFPSAGSQEGISDTLQSIFFSPKEPTDRGLIWGAGPVFLLPTASDELLGSDKWGVGPTGVVLKQAGQWTYGMLANHVFDFAGDDDRDDISNTFLQPFIAYNTKTKTTFTLQTESTYSWEEDEWTSVPINAKVSNC
jgi:hypothetical protein